MMNNEVYNFTPFTGKAASCKLSEAKSRFAGRKAASCEPRATSRESFAPLRLCEKLKRISVIRVPFGILKDEIVEWILATGCYVFLETASLRLCENSALSSYYHIRKLKEKTYQVILAFTS